MANVKITELTAATALAGTDVLPIVDVGADATKKVSVSDLLRNLPDGTASAPALAFADDQNTGVLSPGNNSLAFATSGTQRLVIDSSGRVGIGTASPNHELCISSASPLIQLEDNDHNYTTQISQSGSALFIDSDSANAGSSSIRFRVGGASEKMRISSAGNVGIGTSNPTARLYVQNAQGGANGRILFDANVSSGYDTRIDATDVGLEFTAASNSRGFAFKTGSSPSEKVRIDSSGQLILLGNGGSTTNSLDLNYNGTSGQAQINADSGGGNTFLTFGTSSSGSLSERLRIDSSGRVGIGETSPVSKLIIKNTSSNDGIRIISSTTGEGFLLFGDTADNNTGGIVYSHTNDALEFNVNNSERMRIDSSGRVGIGTASPSYLLDVKATNNTTYTAGNFVNNPVARIHNDSTTTNSFASLVFRTASGDNAIGFKYTGTVNQADFVICNDGGANGNEIFRIDSSGRVLVGTSSSIEAPDAAGNNRDGSLQLAGNLLATTMQGNHFFNVSATGPLYQFTRSNTSTIGNHAIVSSGDKIGTVQWSGSDGTNYIPAARIQAQVDGTPGSNDMPGRLVFSTTADGASSPTERMRITNNGFTKCAGNSSIHSATGLYHEFISNSTDSAPIVFYRQRAGAGSQRGLEVYYDTALNSAGNDFFRGYDSGATRIQLYSNGGIANFSANDVNLSDRNVKKDIVPAADTWNCLKEWEIVRFRYKDQPDNTDLSIGVIAQQVAEGCPELVTIFQEAKEATDDIPAQEERIGVKEQQMMWMAIKALQEAQTRIETLETKIAALEAQ